MPPYFNPASLKILFAVPLGISLLPCLGILISLPVFVLYHLSCSLPCSTKKHPFFFKSFISSDVFIISSFHYIMTRINTCVKVFLTNSVKHQSNIPISINKSQNIVIFNQISIRHFPHMPL